MEWLGFTSSFLMGIALGLLGGGGSILTVPILVYLFGVEPVSATAHSLFIVGITALIGVLSYHAKGLIDLRTGLLFALPGAAGVSLARSVLVPALPDSLFAVGAFSVTKPIFLMLAFSALMITASFSMIRGRKDVPSRPGEAEIFRPSPSLARLATQGFFVGIVTGFVGVGGGFLILPALVLLAGLPMRLAVGTSLAIIAANSAVGFAVDLQKQIAIDWPLLLKTSAIAISGNLFGAGLSSRIPERGLRKGFGYFVLFTGALILFDQLRRL